MKLSNVRPSLETSGNMPEHFFSIQDTGAIFDILRGKMYSNPILAICREISCNARDAHREVGKRDVPIEISLPNNLSPYFKIKDFGPGISHDRMTNIFIKYTASTKRDDNNQTGGFGLGAKTPFSYSDTFSIETVVNGIAYVYSCGIDETRVGKLMLMDEKKTKKPNGTEIIIPVKAVDFNTFNASIENATRHWDVKPVFFGGTIEYKTQTKILEGSNWAFASNNSYQSIVKLIIDGIEYPLDLAALRTYADTSILDSTRATLLLEFGVGELSLSANREAVYLDDPTKNKIKLRLEKVKAGIQKILEDKIATFDSLWDANVYYRQELQSVFYNQSFLGPLSWNNIPLSNKHVALSVPMFLFTKGKYSRKFGTDPSKITKSISQTLNFTENSLLFINDLSIKMPTPKHLKKVFEDNPTIKSVQLICPTDTITISDLNKKIHLDQMKPKLLSSVTKASGRTYTSPVSRLLVYKFDGCIFRQVSYSSFEEDTNDKVLCISRKEEDVYSKNIRSVILKNKKSLELSAIKALSTNNKDVSFYSVDESADQIRIEKEFSNCQSIDDFIEKKIINSKHIDFVKLKYVSTLTYKVNYTLINDDHKIANKIYCPNSLYLKRKNIHTKVRDAIQDDLGMLSIYENLNGAINSIRIDQWLKNNPEYDLLKINQEFNTQYPLLDNYNTYNYGANVKAIIQYINLIDKDKEKGIKNV